MSWKFVRPATDKPLTIVPVEEGEFFYCGALLDYIPREGKAHVFVLEFYPSRVCCFYCNPHCWPEA